MLKWRSAPAGRRAAIVAYVGLAIGLVGVLLLLIDKVS